MEIIGQILLDVGCAALLLGYLGILFCGFTAGVGRGLLSLVFPFIGFGVATQRFPWLVWLWIGGTALVIVGAVFV